MLNSFTLRAESAERESEAMIYNKELYLEKWGTTIGTLMAQPEFQLGARA